MERLEDSQKFITWKANLLRNGCSLKGWKELHIVRKKNGKVLFALIWIDGFSAEGVPLLPVVLLRGPFAAIVTGLINSETGNRSLLLVKQRRVANGEIFYEHPAGMMDSSADPYETALAEMHEETGLELKREDLVLMDEKQYYSSPGLDDEGGYYFYCELVLSSAEIQDLHERKTGDGNESEFIQTVVCSFPEAKSLMRNANSLLHLLLYEALKRGGGA